MASHSERFNVPLTSRLFHNKIKLIKIQVTKLAHSNRFLMVNYNYLIYAHECASCMVVLGLSGWFYSLAGVFR